MKLEAEDMAREKAQVKLGKVFSLLHRCKKLKVFLAIWKSDKKLSAKRMISNTLEFVMII